MIDKICWYAVFLVLVPSLCFSASYTVVDKRIRSQSNGSSIQIVNIKCNLGGKDWRVTCRTSREGETLCSSMNRNYDRYPTLDRMALVLCGAFPTRISEEVMKEVLQSGPAKTTFEKSVGKGMKCNNDLFFIPEEKPLIEVQAENKKQENITIQPMLGFNWGDSIEVAQSKICAIKGVKEVSYGFRSENYDIPEFCSKHINVFAPDGYDYSNNSPSSAYEDLFMSRVNLRGASKIRGSKNKFILFDSNEIVFEPVILKGVAHRVTLSFGSGNEDIAYYRYFKRDDYAPASVVIKYEDGDRHYIYPAALMSVTAEAIDPDTGSAIGPEIKKILQDKYKDKYHVDSNDHGLRIQSNGTTLEYYERGSDIRYSGSKYLEKKHKGFYDLYLKSMVHDNAEDSSSSL